MNITRSDGPSGRSGLDRRTFVKLGIVAAGSAALGLSAFGCAPQQTPSDESNPAGDSTSSDTVDQGGGVAATDNGAGTSSGTGQSGSQSGSSAASSSGESTGDVSTGDVSTGNPTSTLMVYFSREGENYTSSGPVDKGRGNTYVMAGYISDAIACDFFRLRSVEQYPTSYEEMLTVGQDEQDADARPEIANIADLPDLAKYTTILLGSPIWWGKPPMIMRTFLESVDLAGKTLIPFTTSGGSGLGTAVDDYSALTNASVSDNGHSTLGETVDDARDEVTVWAKGL